MNPTVALTVASLKMYFRNRPALFFSLLMPLLLMGIFGVLNFGQFSRVNVGLVDRAHNSVSERLIEVLSESEIIHLTLGTRAELVQRLVDGGLTFLLVLPEDFGEARRLSMVETLFDGSQPEDAQVADAVVSRILNDLTLEISGTERMFELDRFEVQGRQFNYIDFLVPGIIAMSIMQTGIFSVVFAIVQFRQQGVLRRLRAAPIHPGHFLAGQVITRLIVSILQTLVLLGVGIFLLGLDVRGSILALLLLAIIGGAVFISMGYAISGVAKTEESAAPIANLIALPMFFLSGVFFPREVLPSALESITGFFPLTYLAHGMRQVTADGYSLAQISGDLLGLSIWMFLSFVAATALFRWE